MTFVTCRECEKFVQDKIGDGYGIGECTEYTAYAAKRPGDAALRKALKVLGNRQGDTLFWGGLLKDRLCGRFVPVCESRPG